MSTEWSAFQSFTDSQRLLAAINSLAIHIKLHAVGVADDTPPERVEASRTAVVKFLKDLNEAMSDGDYDDSQPMMGVSPRFRQFVQHFITMHPAMDHLNTLRALSTLKHRPFLQGMDMNDQQTMLECLEVLRVLLEEHVHADTHQLLADI